MSKKLYFVRLTKLKDKVSFRVTEGTIEEETDTALIGYTPDNRHDDNKMTWSIKKDKLDRVIRLPFGQSIDHMTLSAYCRDDENVSTLKGLMVKEMQSMIQEEKERIEKAEQVLEDYANSNDELLKAE